MQRYFYFIPIFLFLTFETYAQSVISGVVTDQNGNVLSGASVYDVNSFTGTSTNSDGAFSLRLKDGRHVIGVEHLGFKPVRDTLDINGDQTYSPSLKLSPFITQEVVVSATRAGEATPMAVQNLSSDEVQENNLAQDMPILLNQTVSAVTTSDAGAGVGYTGIRIRGSDATRINVTVNGVPLNDAESHGVFWVNMPDFASTTQNIQIQRGAGTSTNGAAAFGASINLETSGLDETPYAEINNTYGSFNTRRHNAILNTGLIGGRFNAEARLSYIGSDGYIDRSQADLRSYYFAGGYYGERLLLKGVVFAGKEVTHQAWWGTPASRLTGNEEEMWIHASNNGYSEEQTENLLTSGRTYNHYLYENEVDNYAQDHSQLIGGYQLSEKLYLNLTGHYTYGRGYFEQFNEDKSLAEFGLDQPIFGTDTITRGDVIGRRWLDNDFYGVVYALQYKHRGLRLTLGGSGNQYEGDHFGEVIWAEYTPYNDIRERYYESSSVKQDFANYIKGEWLLGSLSFYTDAQVRYIDYRASGVDNDQRPIQIDQTFLFFNPKVGMSYQASSSQRFYISVARASREPTRGDFIDAVQGAEPKPEYMTDLEAGWHFQRGPMKLNTNVYYMDYQNQLVLTGEVNDVGSPVRTNVANSYRAGIEISGILETKFGFFWAPNVTYSQNKIASFSEIVYDYTNGYDVLEIEHKNTDIAFSPSIIAGSQLGYRTDFGAEICLMSKYVGKQFLDNTSNADRVIDPYFVNDVRLTYSLEPQFAKRIEFSVLVNNIFNEMYASNGYTYSYIFGSMITENFYYPQAGTNWLAGLKVRF